MALRPLRIRHSDWLQILTQCMENATSATAGLGLQLLPTVLITHALLQPEPGPRVHHGQYGVP